MNKRILLIVWAAVLLSSVAAMAGGWKSGDDVDVLWKGFWFRASVQQVGDGKYFVHYKGWEATFDEWVAADRVREPISLRPGTLLEVEWKGTWYKSRIVEVSPTQYKIHYEGWGDNFDEWVSFKRMRFPPGVPSWAKGQAVEVSWKGSWYKAVILEVKDGKYLIHYDGYGDNWDEWVNIERIRARQK